MFQGLARDRLERLNASPSATILSHLRVYTVLLFVLLFDLLWLVDFLLQLQLMFLEQHTRHIL
jgi:hypothetical protein